MSWWRENRYPNANPAATLARAVIVTQMSLTTPYKSFLPLIVAAACCGVFACSESERPEVVASSDASGATGGAGGRDAAADAVAVDASGPDGGAGDASVTPLSPVRLGLLPVPPSSLGQPNTADQLQTDLELISSGARAVTLQVRWDELFEGPSQAVDSKFVALAQRATLYASSGVTVLVCVAMIDRSVVALPEGLTGFADPDFESSAELLVDHLFDALGQSATYVSFGLDVDRYFGLAPAAERVMAQAGLSHALGYAASHPKRPAGSSLGITVSLLGLLDAPEAEVLALVGLGDAWFTSYLAFDTSYRAAAASSPAQRLDALSALVAKDPLGRPVVLQQVGYPTDDAVQGSVQKQKTFFDAFFTALATRRERFPFVVTAPLHDGPVPKCASGAPHGDVLAESAYCSLGVRSAAAQPRPVQASVLSALAAFSTP